MSEGLHSLRVGGAIAYSNALEGDEMVETAMSTWELDARRAYLYACEGRMHAAALVIGQQPHAEIARGHVGWIAANQ